MTQREKHIAQRKKELIKIAKMQARLITKAAKIATLPFKHPATLMRRMGKVLSIAMQVRSLDIQKQIIASQPIPNYISGGVFPSGIAIVSESGPEQIILPNGTIETANQYPHPHLRPPSTICPVPGIDKEPGV